MTDDDPTLSVPDAVRAIGSWYSCGTCPDLTEREQVGRDVWLDGLLDDYLDARERGDAAGMARVRRIGERVEDLRGMLAGCDAWG